MKGLVVWDFDLSLLSEVNTDTWIVKQCSKSVYDEELKKHGKKSCGFL